MSEAMQEMSLEQWVGRLPKSHRAHKEYINTQARLEEAEKIIADIPAIYNRMGVQDIDLDGLCEWAEEFLANQNTDKE